MKKIYKLIAISQLLFLTACKSEKVSLFIGESISVKDSNYIDLFKNELNITLNNDFASSIFYQKSFYNQLEKDAINLTSNNRINSLLKNTDLIIYNIGNYELQRLITYDEYSVYYNQEELNNGLELFEYYLYHCLDILTDYTKNIIVIPLYCSVFLEENCKSIYLKLMNSFNEIIYKLTQEFSTYYVEIDKMSRFVYKNNGISEPGFSYLCRQIKDVYDFN